VFGLSIRYPDVSGVKAWICQGAFAEYVCAPQSTVVLKPENVTFEQAAAAPVASLTALQGLRLGGLDPHRSTSGQIRPPRVLIHGAAGGVGTFAVQIAKSFGAHVTGICGPRNVELLRSIGADQAIGYTRVDITREPPEPGHRYDLFFDCIGNHSLSVVRRLLSAKGTYIAVGGPSSRWLIGLLIRPLQMLALYRAWSAKNCSSCWPYQAKTTSSPSAGSWPRERSRRSSTGAMGSVKCQRLCGITERSTRGERLSFVRLRLSSPPRKKRNCWSRSARDFART